MAPFSLQEAAVWTLPVVGAWVVMKFEVHPLVFAALGTPFVLGLIPKLYVFILLLMRGVEETPGTPGTYDDTAMSKRERLRRNLLALNIMGPIASTARPLNLESLSKHTSSRSAPSSPRGPISPRRMGSLGDRLRKFDGDKQAFFASSKFAGCLREEECDQLFAVSTWRTIAAGEVLCRFGDNTDSGLFMVVDGTLSVYRVEHDASGDPQEILSYYLQPGESVGDLDILQASSTRTRTVVAAETTTVIQITKAAWRAFCVENPDALLLFIRLAIGRLYRVSHFMLAEFLSIPEFAHTLSHPDVLLLDDPAFPERAEVAAMFAPGGALGTTVVPVAKGTVLHRPGEPSNEIFVLISGSVKVVEVPLEAPPLPTTSQEWERERHGNEGVCMATPTQLRAVEAGVTISGPGILGFRAFSTATDQRHLVVVESSAKIARFDLEALMDLACDAPEEFVQLLLVGSQILFPVINRFVSLGLNRHWVNAGDRVFKEGDDADGLYVLITGRVKLGAGGGYSPARDVGRGDMLGEESMLEDVDHAEGEGGKVVRHATAVCLRDSELVKIMPQNMEHIAAASPTAGIKLLRSIANRHLADRSFEQNLLIQGRSRTANLSTIAIVPLGSTSEADVDTLMRRLALALQKFGSVRVLDKDEIAGILGEATVNHLSSPFYRTRVSSWIVQEEEDYRFVLLRADPKDTAWSKLCVSQADCVLLAASPTETLPTVSAWEEALCWTTPPHHADDLSSDLARKRTELVLLHRGVPDGCEGEVAPPPRNTKLWLEPRPGTKMHHHIRLGHARDTERLSRHLAGRAVGLVLGGGGARGLAHLGVLRAMEDLNIPVDFIGGTSQGAFMAACYAQRGGTEAMAPAIDALSSGIGSISGLMRDLTLPLLSTFSGRSFSHTIRQGLGTTDIRDTWINFFCVTTAVNATKPEEVCCVHREGPIWKFVRASMTVIGFLPPIQDKGHLLVDGGYVNNLPADVMIKMGVHTVIGVDVEDKSNYFDNLIQTGDSVSGWFVLWRKVIEFFGLGGKQRLPKFSAINAALTYAMHTSQFPRQQKLLDLRMEPNMKDVFLLDYHRKQEIVERGYSHAVEKLRAFVQKVQLAEAKKADPHAETCQTIGGRLQSSMPSMAIARQESMQNLSLWEPPSPQVHRGSVTNLSGLDQLSFSPTDPTDAFSGPEQLSFSRCKDPKDVFAETFANAPVSRTRSSLNRGRSEQIKARVRALIGTSQPQRSSSRHSSSSRKAANMSRSNSLVSLSEGGGGGTPLSRSHSDLSISADANANAANAESSNDLFGSPLDKGQGGSPPCSPGLGMGAADSGASPPFTSGPSPPLTPMPAPGEADQEE